MCSSDLEADPDPTLLGAATPTATSAPVAASRNGSPGPVAGPDPDRSGDAAARVFDDELAPIEPDALPDGLAERLLNAEKHLADLRSIAV